ncbi:inactive peptidyl-prolyl cis-trans isomerase shutdown-like isoform X1 [Zerene cesonia]|uniref:inactive peptidyl-prolyl cis-trans isomerase shutdown-like isoform X1 n=1 Tax=Zerene cesonia TaxID=33412 RepID=UPI0018E4F993|nr:inactive peptidyl-prolyl cis-trans isomerase shutdown-like isoform X1 [Zerene cesonia]
MNVDEMAPIVALENGLDIKQLLTSGSVLQINEDYDDLDHNAKTVTDEAKNKDIDIIGEPVKSFSTIEKHLTNVDVQGYVKKKVLEEGGGMPLHEGCTVSIAFSGYWENEPDPFDIQKPSKPMVVDLKDNGLLPGLLLAVKSMLVGETSIFLLSHELMYGELGVPPRIKPKAKCVFYVKLMKSILTPKEGLLNLSEPNTFIRVHEEVKMLYVSGLKWHKLNNFTSAIQLFRKGVSMLHRCRLADESEEEIQKKLLIKIYTNLAICYNITKQPYKACIACNELNRLGSLWNNGKVLYQNAKALRMIGQFNDAEKKLRRAINLCPNNNELKVEFDLLEKTSNDYNLKKSLENRSADKDTVDRDFKKEVDSLIKNFKENMDLCKLTLPAGMNSFEIEYIKEACVRENVFFNKIQADYLLDKDDGKSIELENKEFDTYGYI